jgi:putative endonuclease
LRHYYVYLLTNQKRTLYVGVTNDLVRRVYEHRHKLVDGFTKKYNLSWLVFYESTGEVESAIAREKQIKGWSRAKKVALIESTNPRWVDLAQGWYDDIEPS